MSVLKKIMQIILLIVLVLSFIVIGIPVGVIIAFWNDLPSLEPLEYETQSWHYPAKIYSDIAYIQREASLDKLLERLKRLDYSQFMNEPTDAGQFHLKNPADSPTNEMKLYLRDLRYPRFILPARQLTIRIKAKKIAEIQNTEGRSLTKFVLEPEEIAEFYGSEGTDRELVYLSEIPDTLTNAFIAIEDKRFYKHPGFDLYRIAGSLWRNIKHIRDDSYIVQGASTITQQLARDLFLTRQQLYTRKIKEALLAVKIERKYTKGEILERYLNRIDLGRYGAREVYGIRQAARYYFGKDVLDLNLPECAALASLPKDQTRYSPVKNPENSKGRRRLVLRQMMMQGFITEQEYRESSEAQLVTVPLEMQSSSRYVASYFLEYIRGQLESKYEPSALHRRGLKIYTTLDMSMQIAANKAVEDRLRELDAKIRFQPYAENRARWFAGEREKGVRHPKGYLQAALMSIDPATGNVKAMVGGRDFYASQFNRAVQSRRSPGSAFKPFIFCTAFAHNMATATTIVMDEQWETEDPSSSDGFWRPENFYEMFYGQVTVRKMLTRSINVATARFLSENIVPEGPAKAVAIARAMGIKSPLAAVPALALGSSGVSLLELTSAYGVWANQGMRAEPISVRYILDMEGNILEENTPPARRVLDEEVAYLMAYLMQGVVNGGTGRNLRKLHGFDRPAAGKTGTTNDEADAWFMGFLPDLAVGVWVGFDDYGKSIGYTGALAALPIWASFIKSVADGPVKDFPVPDGIIFKDVDAETGMLATSRTTNIVREAFIKGTEE